ncbi:hypothetical protein Tco_1475696 [Tanacetum coccineum]
MENYQKLQGNYMKSLKSFYQSLEMQSLNGNLSNKNALNAYHLPTIYPKINKIKSVSVKKLHGYSHLKEVMVKRSDQQFYKFKEGNFVDLHLNDIEDMLLLAVQHKLSHLEGSVIVDFIMALRMFIRSLILKSRVEELQLGVESY